MAGLYIHVPFCLSKCPYCDFYSVVYSKERAKKYSNAVIANLRHYPNNIYDTVYFGGGTPVLLWQEISKIMQEIRISDDCEVSIEANPCCTTEEALQTLFSSGVNRISFGVQSGIDAELKQLGRRHSVAEAERAIRLAYSCRFRNISADLMLATPLQTAKSALQSVDFLCSLPINHVSAYMLKIEANTPFATRDLPLPNEDEVCDIYLQAADRLESNGFFQYEISNFAQKDYECRHNLKYWRCEEYLGIGPGAHSFYGGKRFFTEQNLNEFCNIIPQKTIVEDDNPRGFDEYLMLRLRLNEGLCIKDCEQFGVDPQIILERVKSLPSHFYKLQKGRVSLTKQGFLVSNVIIGKILGY